MQMTGYSPSSVVNTLESTVSTHSSGMALEMKLRSGRSAKLLGLVSGRKDRLWVSARRAVEHADPRFGQWGGQSSDSLPAQRWLRRCVSRPTASEKLRATVGPCLHHRRQRGVWA
jgi:hypothetical protein